MSELLDRPLVPVANPDDAAETYERFRPYLLETDAEVLVVHVIEKAGGAPDKAGVQQRKEHAEAAFEAFRKRAELDGVDVDTELRYGTDVAEAICEAAADHDASAIAFSSRGGSRWVDFATGNVRSKLVVDTDRPVLVLPSGGEQP